MYYLTYRPQTVSSLDNTQVRKHIENLLSSKSVPHALLFVGTKGMGKTSTARIFAKSLNCLSNRFAKKGDSIEPCNKCTNCLSIDAGSSPDVIEQDAASNRGIDEVRKLIRESSYSPMMGRSRVYIIDEAHMITPDAFNALLKTLEEPPKTVVFILATTNEEKIPKTIISRCSRVSFGTATREDIVHMLKRIIGSEKISLPEDVINLISTYSENSFRDATKLLEELVTQNKLTVLEAEKYLGIRAKDHLLGVISGSDTPSVPIAWVESFIIEGGNIKRIIEDTLQKLKNQLLLKNGLTTDIQDLGMSLRDITILMKLMHEAYGGLRTTPIESLPLEIAIVEFYNQRDLKISK